MAKDYERILITGAAGRLGGHLRKGLAHLANHIRLADLTEITDLAPHEEAMSFDLADTDAVARAMEGVDAVVHFGGAPLETQWNTILASNIEGTYNIYEAARRKGVKRVVYASSVHAIGYHKLTSHIDEAAPVRPDSLYGVSKCFVEALARLYWDKFGMESVCLRIFSSFPEPPERRMLWSWLSFTDCVRLVEASLTAPHVGFTIAYGLSDNKVCPVDTSNWKLLGYHPQDNTEFVRAKVESTVPPLDPHAPATQYLGGWFVDLPHPDDEVAK
ncbi:NAD(P)-dependent oxidoreductase [Paracoccus sp. R12_1]|uniref:NAD-dependent epimerase/dehydratase family protein n=1 Tax=unclassified Paracoccus (in: a-proteobacteria) TaxID=2688777 RepID=UPI001ADB2E53|nr:MULTISPECIES: NAD(P)-dependent oxidoreductase [unclassified Paracoccus (in: a-proteobacteria)]MBO9456994.1 NAD(P)-dependent oxidoreductase [Paracoccus sp. R12_2]MBO9488121.1 NAD(P)-dependent oxidoreductase [Paracoccus sp. R12_1]